MAAANRLVLALVKVKGVKALSVVNVLSANAARVVVAIEDGVPVALVVAEAEIASDRGFFRG
jgi:hypothetical protein